MENLSVMHILVLAVIFLFFFGAKKLPEMGQAMGKGIREFKKGMRDDLPDTADMGRQDPMPKAGEGPKKLSE
jgi:sec-independent protein translocase protein TatA